MPCIYQLNFSITTFLLYTQFVSLNKRAVVSFKVNVGAGRYVKNNVFVRDLQMVSIQAFMIRLAHRLYDLHITLRCSMQLIVLFRFIGLAVRCTSIYMLNDLLTKRNYISLRIKIQNSRSRDLPQIHIRIL